MKYDEENCYWCGKFIGENNHAFASIATDTLKTMRNFCCEDHLLKFKEKATGKKTTLKLKPYYGKVDKK